MARLIPGHYETDTRLVPGHYETSADGGVSIAALLNSNYMVEYTMKKNVASQSIGAQMITISDGTDFTGTVTAEVTVDSGTKTAGGGTVTHEGEGYHSYAPTQAETNGDHVAVSFAGTGALSQTVQVYTTFPQTVDNDTKISAISTVVPPSVSQLNARTLVAANYFDPATDTVADVTLVATTTGVTNQVTADVTAISGDSVAADNLEASLETLLLGTATGTPTTTTMADSALTEATDNHFNGRVIIWRTGALAKQATNITGYNGTTKTFTFTATTDAATAADEYVVV